MGAWSRRQRERRERLARGEEGPPQQPGESREEQECREREARDLKPGEIGAQELQAREARDYAAKKGEARPDPKGRLADRPTKIPPPGWMAIFKRTWSELTKDNVGLISAGVAFYFLLALAPALASFVSIYGLVLEPSEVQTQVEDLSTVLPADARSIITDQLERIVSQPDATLGLSFIISLGLALWSTSAATKSIMTAMNIAYEEKEKRGFIRFNANALMLTLGAIVFIAVSLALIAVVPAVIDRLGLGRAGEIAVAVLRWPILGVLVLGGLAAMYRYAPSRDEPKWSWVTTGSVVATVLWLAASAGFSLYVSKFGNYNETYGSLGAIVVMMLWMYITAYVVILGAELNAEMEHQTARDTTVGPEKPLGQRRAYVADTVAK
jgi:membrane protein